MMCGFYSLLPLSSSESMRACHTISSLGFVSTTVHAAAQPDRRRCCGADTLPESKAHSTPGVAQGYGSDTLFHQWITYMRRGWRDAVRPDVRGR